MFKELQEYEMTQDMRSTGGHDRCLKILINAPRELVEFSNHERMLNYLNRIADLSCGLMKVVKKSLDTGELIKDGHPEPGVIITEFEALNAEYPKEKSVDQMTDEEINRLIDKKTKK